MKRMMLLCLCLLLVCVGARAEGAQTTENYAAYLARYGTLLSAMDAVSVSKKAAVGESLELTLTTEKDIFVYPVFTYRMLDATVLDNSYQLTLDGAYPYAECTALALDNWWATPETFSVDRYGNEVSPMPEKVYDWATQGLTGKEALYDDGMGLYLSKGEHTLRLTCREGPFEISNVSFVMPSEVKADVTGVTLSGSGQITLQAERAALRSSPNIRSAAIFNTSLTPYETSGKRINYIEDTSWKYAGDKLVYHFSADSAGYYGLSLRCRQDEKTDFPVWRTVLIDGEIPGAAFKQFAIPQMSDFGNYIVKNAAGETAVVYLMAGAHTLTLEATSEPLREEIDTLTRIADEMSAFSLSVSKITGGNSDAYRDFDLSAYGLDAAASLKKWRDEMQTCYDRLVKFGSVQEPGELSSLAVAISLMDVLLKAPDDLPKNQSLFAQGSSSARFYVIDQADSLRLSPLGLDSVSFFQDPASLPAGMNFFTSVASSASRFAASFATQAYEAGGESDGQTLQVWLNRPRQILEILQQMIDSDYTKKTGVKIDLSIMPDSSKLILANASGTAPDVAVGISSGSVFDLAVRGVLTDMRRFDSFKEVASRFSPGLLIPGAYGDGCYALPETFNFYVLFYRKDIVESLGLTLPDTMEDVRNLIPTLQRYGMNYNNYVANSIGYKSFAVTLPYIVQKGGRLFETGNLKTLLTSDEALSGIRELTDDFIVYSMDYEVDSFYQSFRDGTLPIGTGNMSTYLLLLNAAPEIADQWGIALFPGVRDENGVVQRWTCNAAESSVIFSSSKLQQEAMDFLDWYMSDDVQTEFGYRLQATMGNEYLWNSANLNAFKASSWPSDDKEIILEQLGWTWEPTRVLGGYMVERELSNAVNAIVLNKENLRTAMDEAVKRIDREVARKMEAYGLTEDDFVMIDVDTIRRWLE